MNHKNNSTHKPRPHVEWGSLIIFVISAIVEIALCILHFYANTGRMADASIGIGYLAEYGWLIGPFGLLFGFDFLIEGFIPSWKSYQKWKSEKLYKDEVKRMVRSSALSNQKKLSLDYQNFLEEIQKEAQN